MESRGKNDLLPSYKNIWRSLLHPEKVVSLIEGLSFNTSVLNSTSTISLLIKALREDMVSQNYERVPDTKRSPADPQKDAGLFSLLTFWWMNGVFQTGAKRPLEESDFLPLQEQDETQRLTENIQKLWSCEKKKCAESGKKPRLWKSVLKAVSLRQWGFLLFTNLLYFTCRVLQPLLLGFLVSEMMDIQNDDRSLLYVCAAAMSVNALVRSQVQHQCFYRSLLLGMQLRAALKGVVYLKVSPLFSTSMYVIDIFSRERNSGLWSHADIYANEHCSDAIARLCNL